MESARRLIGLLLLFAVLSSAFADGPQCALKEGTAFKWSIYPPANSISQAARNASSVLITSWWCPGKYAPSGWFYSVPVAKLPANVMDLAAKAFTASLDEILAAQTQYMTVTLSPEMRAVGVAQLDATRPASPVWLVAKNSTFPDRPLYRVENGVRNTTAIKGSRAAVGAVCACASFALEEGAATFCPLAGTPPELGKVALCK